MKASEILLRAAELCESSIGNPIYEHPLGACDSLGRVYCGLTGDHGDEYDAAVTYLDLFESTEPDSYGYWWKRPLNANAEEHNARILGLLFAREIALDEERK